MTEAAKGTLAITACYAIWGLSPIFYKALAAVPPSEVLAHRTIWSVVALGAVLALQGRLARLGALLRRRPGRTLLAGGLIGANWFLFIHAVGSGETLQSALGYYVLPLGAALTGRLLFGERLGPLRWAALALAATAIAVLGAGAGGVPWLALGLAATFLGFSVVKKNARDDAVLTTCAEALVLAPLALGWLWAVHSGAAPLDPRPAAHALTIPAPPGAFGDGAAITLLLAAAGPMTAGPLMLYSYAATRIELGQAGFLIYLNSTLQLACGVLLFGEAFTMAHATGFALIWAALAAYTLGGRRFDPAAAGR
ncbi:MAG: EamA family transporter RarD [Hasllibacter sp.]